MLLNAADDNVGIGKEATAYKLAVATIAADLNSDGVLSLEQYADNTGHALNISNISSGGRALNISHGASTSTEAVYIANGENDQALFIEQTGNTSSSQPSASSGGAIHVVNTENSGSAITLIQTIQPPPLLSPWSVSGLMMLIMTNLPYQ